MDQKKVIVRYAPGSSAGAGGTFEIVIPSRGVIEEDRETVYRYMNHVDGDPDGVEAQLRSFKIRSMDVGDSVEIDGKVWACAGCGWTLKA